MKFQNNLATISTNEAWICVFLAADWYVLKGLLSITPENFYMAMKTYQVLSII